MERRAHSVSLDASQARSGRGLGQWSLDGSNRRVLEVAEIASRREEVERTELRSTAKHECGFIVTMARSAAPSRCVP